MIESREQTKRYRIIEHPSDLGIEALGSSLAEAFEAAAQGFISLIIDPATIESTEVKKITLQASDEAQLLVRWLSEILYLYDGQGFICREFSITQISQMSLEATVAGERFSPSKHRTRLDVKATTYHQLLVQQNDHGALVRVYVDI